MVLVMTEEWRLLELDGLPGIETQTIYHTLGEAMDRYDDIENTIVLCWPEDPVVCVGYHQIIEEEVDTEYCQKNNLPIGVQLLGQWWGEEILFGVGKVLEKGLGLV